MAKRRALIATFFFLALITGIKSAQASSIDFTVTVSLSGDGVSGSYMSVQLADNAPISGETVLDAKNYYPAIQVNDYWFTSYGEWPWSTYIIQGQAQVTYTAQITQDAANPFQNATWNAYLSTGQGTYSIFQKDLNPANLADQTFDGFITIPFSIDFPIVSREYTLDGGRYNNEVAGSSTLTLHLEQSGQSAANPVPVPGTAYLLGSGLVALVGRKLRLRPRKS